MARLLAALAPSPHGWGVELAHEIILQGSAAGHAVRVCAMPSEPTQIPPADVVFAQIFTQHQATALERMRVPVVNLDGGLDRLPFTRIGIDQAGAGRLVADHLRMGGMTAGAFVGIGPRHNSRLMGHAFVNRLAEFGIASQSCMVDGAWRTGIPGSDADRRDDDRLRAMLLRLPVGTGILAWGPEVATAVVDLCGTARTFPHDLRLVAGADDLLLSVAPMPISAVRQSAAAVVAAALSRLAMLLAGSRQTDTHLIAPAEVVVRSSSDPGQASDPAIARALAALRSGLDHRLEVDEIAAMAGLNRRTLERRFRAVTGRGVLAELVRLRMLRAGELLANGMPVAEVATRCGYAGLPQFSRQFKAHHGVAPSAWQ